MTINTYNRVRNVGYTSLKTTLLAEPAIHADETPLKVIKAEKVTSYMWVYCCGIDALGSNTALLIKSVRGLIIPFVIKF